MSQRPTPFTDASKVLAFSVFGGAICGWARYGFEIDPWSFSAVLVGAFTGAVISPLEIGLLHHRSLEKAAPIILIPSMLVAVSATILTEDYMISLLSVPVFVFLTVYARLKLPSTLPKPGLCPHCGYNLTGNTSGKCPECGQMWQRGSGP